MLQDFPAHFFEELKKEDWPEGYGIAFDMGTTTLVGILWDLKHMKQMGLVSRTNPQRRFGIDVISRIAYCNGAEGNLAQLQQLLLSTLNEMIGVLCQRASIEEAQVNRMVLVGNTTMSHLFLGKDPASLAVAPFAPAFTGQVEMKGEEAGLGINPKARIILLPNLAGHVGSDTTGVLLATRAKELPGLRLIIDIGTNGELALIHNGEIAICSTAAGPAFEGGALQKGMRAAKGAIQRIDILGDRVLLGVMGGEKPIGLCGSGAVDGVAQMLKTGIIDGEGTFREESDSVYLPIEEGVRERVRKGEKGKEFLLASQTVNGDIVLTQKDIRELQMAKAAIYGGIILLLRHFHQDVSALEEIFLAGAFGNYIRKESAMDIGLIPRIGGGNVRSIGNAAARGASMALLSAAELEKSQAYPAGVTHIELALHDDFQEEYLKGMYFPDGQR